MSQIVLILCIDCFDIANYEHGVSEYFEGTLLITFSSTSLLIKFIGLHAIMIVVIDEGFCFLINEDDV